jgi:hypothetical protein
MDPRDGQRPGKEAATLLAVDAISSRNSMLGDSKIPIGTVTQQDDSREVEDIPYARFARMEKLSYDLMTSGTACYEENGVVFHAELISTKPTLAEVVRFFQVDIPQPEEEEGHDGFVFFIRARGSLNVMIGYSKDPVERLQELQRGNLFELDLEQAFFSTTAFETDQYLREELKDHHVRGYWFKLTTEEVMGAFLKQSVSRNPS